MVHNGECPAIGAHSSIQLVSIVRCPQLVSFFDAVTPLVKAIYEVERGGYPTTFVLSKNKGLAAVYPPRFLLVSFFHLNNGYTPPLFCGNPHPLFWMGTLSLDVLDWGG